MLIQVKSRRHITHSQNQNQNQNCYWWHVQMTIIHQDLWWGKLVPSPYKRSELSNRVFCSFSSRKESICKWIPISNSLGKEAALVNVSISKGGLKCQRVVISDMPNWGDKVIRRYTGCTLQTFVKHYDSTISPPFFQRFRDSHRRGKTRKHSIAKHQQHCYIFINLVEPPRWCSDWRKNSGLDEQ